MSRLWKFLGILTVATLAAFSAPAASPLHPVVVAAPIGSAATNPQVERSVTIQTFQFKPSTLEVKVGARVTWINQDDIAHTVTSGTPENRGGRFDARLNGKGSSFSFTFTQPGTYSFFCNRHQSMRGQIRVN